ncbi:MAG: nuclear transport factor 2 family protein [Sphingobacteriales bacterium]|nr:nuclear transport factor 2 family protein [Sphingobacteriales bacterium]
MKYFFILLTVLFCGIGTKAQTAEDSVKAVVNTLFTGMKNADAALLKTCFADSMVLQTIVRGKEGGIKVINENPAEFIDFVSKQKPGLADERIRFETIKIDGPLALVWTPYEFYYNGQFSHCGVNSFHLVRFGNGWKIQFLIDTRRKQGCQ